MNLLGCVIPSKSQELQNRKAGFMFVLTKKFSPREKRMHLKQEEWGRQRQTAWHGEDLQKGARNVASV